jgi:hypothetical protein
MTTQRTPTGSKWHRAIGRSESADEASARALRHAALAKAKAEAAKRFGSIWNDERVDWINARQAALIQGRV